MKLLLDINVVLDVILKRGPWAEDAARVLAAVENGDAIALVAGHTITTVHYIVAKTSGKATATAAVSELLRIVGVVPVERADLHQALALGWKDFEDAVQAVCALRAGVDHLVTRDPDDFEHFSIPIAPPSEVLALPRAKGTLPPS